MEPVRVCLVSDRLCSTDGWGTESGQAQEEGYTSSDGFPGGEDIMGNAWMLQRRSGPGKAHTEELWNPSADTGPVSDAFDDTYVYVPTGWPS